MPSTHRASTSSADASTSNDAGCSTPHDAVRSREGDFASRLIRQHASASRPGDSCEPPTPRTVRASTSRRATPTLGLRRRVARPGTLHTPPTSFCRTTQPTVTPASLRPLPEPGVAARRFRHDDDRCPSRRRRPSPAPAVVLLGGAAQRHALECLALGKRPGHPLSIRVPCRSSGSDPPWQVRTRDPHRKRPHEWTPRTRTGCLPPTELSRTFEGSASRCPGRGVETHGDRGHAFVTRTDWAP